MLDCGGDKPKHYLKSELDRLLMSTPAMLDFLLKSSLDGLWYWDLEKPDNEWMSPEFWRLFGHDPDSKSHNPAEWQDMIFGEDLDLAMKNFDAHCADSSHPYDQTVRYRHKNGSTVWVRCRGMAIRDDTGKPIRMLGAHTEVTEVKLARAENRSLLAANEGLQSVAYALSHALKSPATTIHTLTEELARTQQGRMDADGRSLVSLIGETSGRMQKLIEALLEYASIVDAPSTFRAVDLGALVKSSWKGLAPLAATSGARLETGDLPQAWGDPRQLGLAIQHLIHNAVTYAAPGVGNKTHVSADCMEGGAVMLHVRDDGIGVAKADQKRIFDMFNRLHREEDYPGYGLGLALVHRVALNHRGRITVQSDTERGSTFTLHLPGRPM